MAYLIAPSVLSADFGNLARDCEMLNQSEANWFHVDIMDGVFVPNISFGFPVIQAIKKCAKKPLDVHLMIHNPSKFIDIFHESGADILTIHWEGETHLHRTIHAIKQKGMKAAVALNPHTPIEFVHDIVTDCDMILLMSVNPGFGGQKFIPGTFDRLKRLKDLIMKRNSNCLIEIDGGVNLGNAAQLINAGADVLVVGSFVFNSENPKNTISDLKNVLK